MTLGFERSLPTPLASAAVIKKSTAKFGERGASSKPLVGPPASRLLTKGITGGVEFAMLIGGAGFVVPKVLLPTSEAPPIMLRPPSPVPEKASCVPISRAKERDAETTRSE